MNVEVQDVTGTPRPVEDIRAALKFADAELIQATKTMRMGAGGTGPAVMHLIVIRDVLRAELAHRGA